MNTVINGLKTGVYKKEIIQHMKNSGFKVLKWRNNIPAYAEKDNNVYSIRVVVDTPTTSKPLIMIDGLFAMTKKAYNVLQKVKPKFAWYHPNEPKEPKKQRIAVVERPDIVKHAIDPAIR